MFKKQKGITLIALVITIIVLLILAGVTIAAITSNESAPNKAVQARDENEIGAAKDAATLLVTEKIQAYYEGKYVGSDETARGSGTIRDYLENANVLGSTNGVRTGEYTVKVASGKITVKKGETPMATGTVSPEGVITWDGQQAELPKDSVQKLAQDGAIKRWDTINYNPGTLTTASIDLPEGAKIEGTKVADMTALDGKTTITGATLDGTISASSASNWVVLDVTDNGDVLIMPRTVSETTLTLTGMDGYNNAVEALDMVAGIYLNPAQAESARSLRVEDVNKVEGHTPDGAVAGPYEWNHRYGMNPTTLDITDTGSDSNIISQTYTSTATTGYYGYWAPSFGGFCWLASRCVDLNSDYCGFIVRYLDGGVVYNYNLFYVYSDGSCNDGDSSNSYAVVPVVTLKSDIQLETGDPFYTETATATTAVDEVTEYVHHAWTIKNSTN